MHLEGVDDINAFLSAIHKGFPRFPQVEKASAGMNNKAGPCRPV
jgi:hypothetical protein